MLIIQVNQSGERTVVLERDWHAGCISRSYVQPRRNYMADEGVFMHKLQGHLLRDRKIPTVGKTGDEDASE